MEPDRSIDPRPEPGGRRARRVGRAGRAGRSGRSGRLLWRGTRVLIGPLVVTGAVFGMVFASAGSESGPTSIDGAQPVNYYEECEREGCSREEVVELWESFRSECIDEECWMEEIAELSGGAVSQDRSGNWVYTRSTAVAEMMDYFVDRLGHTRAAFVRVRPGKTDRAWEQLVDMILDQGGEIPVVTCRLSDGRVYDCHAGG